MYEEQAFDIKSALDAMGGDRELYTEVAEAYCTTTPLLLERIRESITRSDRETLKREAHSLKSSSRAVGAMQVGATAEGLEKKAATLSAEAVMDTLEQLRNEYAVYLRELNDKGVMNYPVDQPD